MGTFIDFLKPSTSKYKYTELDMSGGKVSIKTEGILKNHMRTVYKTPWNTFKFLEEMVNVLWNYTFVKLIL